MLEYFEHLLNTISPMTAYLALGISAFLENVVPPIPGDTVVVFGAYMVSIGKLDFWGVYISTTLGSVVGFVTMYLAGWKFGRTFIQQRRLREKIFKAEDIKKVEVWFGKWGYWVIFANRFLSGTRSVISLFAGFFHLKIYYVFILGLISAAVWHAILIIAGILVGKNWHVISTVVLRYNQFFLLLIIILITFFVIRRIKRRKTLAAKTHEE
jgi:membrane protein DedA with SNARE-associated domain